MSDSSDVTFYRGGQVQYGIGQLGVVRLLLETIKALQVVLENLPVERAISAGAIEL